MITKLQELYKLVYDPAWFKLIDLASACFSDQAANAQRKRRIANILVKPFWIFASLYCRWIAYRLSSFSHTMA